jgi:nucleotide-binding universal stress UspA family protein
MSAGSGRADNRSMTSTGHDVAAPRRILVPVDGSRAAEAALHVGVALARGLGATLTLLATAPLVEEPIPTTALAAYGTLVLPEEQQEALDQRAKGEVDEAAAELPADVDVRTCVSAGPAGPAIVDEVASGGHDLVVLCRHGRGTVGRLLHDHTAHHVLDHSGVPVLVLPAPASS